MNRNLNFLLAAIIFASCKDNPPPAPPPISDPAEPTVSIEKHAGARAVLQATYISTLKTEHQLGYYTFFKGSAQARFLNSNKEPATIKEIVCEGHYLERDVDTYHSTTQNDYGIDFGSTISWNVMGKGDVPDFSMNVNKKVPEIGDLNVRDSINTKDSLWLRIDMKSPFTFISEVDSVRLSLIGKLGSFNYSGISTSDSVLITPDALKTFGLGKAYLKAEVVLYNKKSYQGYPVAFVNKGMFYKPVWLH